MTDTDYHINYTAEAFKNPINLGGLFLGTLAAVVLMSFNFSAEAVLTAIFGFELVYLGTVPKLPGFRKKIELRKSKERNAFKNEKEMFRALDLESQKKFLALKRYADLIRENFKKMPYTSQGLLENLNKKIDDLLINYLEQLSLLVRYEEYISSDVESSLKKEVILQIDEINKIDSPRLKQTKTRRIAILQKRLQKFRLAREKYLVSETQAETIQDAVRYIYEQSLTMTNAEEIDFQLDTLLTEVDETSQIIMDLDQNVSIDYPQIIETELDFNAILEEISTDLNKITLPDKKLKDKE